jgi:uncharacterized protein (DUF486 family)
VAVPGNEPDACQPTNSPVKPLPSGLSDRFEPRRLDDCGILLICGGRRTGMSVITKTALLLTASNIFMTFAWYGHLKNLASKPWYIAALVSWGIALFEYLLQVPANRIGHTELEVGQLKIMQEAITLSVFVPFAVLYLKEPVRLNYLWAALCLCGAVYFVFRK